MSESNTPDVEPGLQETPRDWPRYLPHLANREILHMGLTPLDTSAWIATDTDYPRYHENKLAQRRNLGDRVYRALPSSSDAQQELADALLAHLTQQRQALYRRDGHALFFEPANLKLALTDKEVLWNAALWIADDIVLLQEINGEYRLTAASLCSPSHWLLEEKFDQPLASIHASIPGFSASLSPAVERFFRHLKVQHPVERFNWSLQAGNALCQRSTSTGTIPATSPLFYRCERQTLMRLPQTGAVVFTIRVYIHPLESLGHKPGALPALFDAIDGTPPALAVYKGFPKLELALQKYRDSVLPAR